MPPPPGINNPNDVAQGHHLVVTQEEERAWPHPATVFTPLVGVDPALAERLEARFAAVLQGELTAAEREYASRYRSPQIEVGTEPGGDHLLRISFGGAITMVEWDGTQDDAALVIDSVASSDAYGASAGYWIHEGWRTRQSFTGEEGNR